MSQSEKSPQLSLPNGQTVMTVDILNEKYKVIFMKISALSKIAKKYKLSFLRVFGSFVVTPHTARDIDLVYAPLLTRTQETLALIRELENYFNHPVDLTPLTLNSSALLAREVAKGSKPLYEDKKSGMRDYILLIDALLAKAEDSKIYKPDTIRKTEFDRKLKELKR